MPEAEIFQRTEEMTDKLLPLQETRFENVDNKDAPPKSQPEAAESSIKTVLLAGVRSNFET